MEKGKWAWPIGGPARPTKATRVGRPRGNPRGRRRLGGGGGALGFPRGWRTPTPSTAYINPPGVPWLIHSLSLPLFFLTWLTCLEHRVEGNSSCQTSSCCQISSLNPSSSAVLLDWSPNDVYTPHVCNHLEAPLVRCYLLWLVRLHDLEAGFGYLHRQRSCGNVPAHSVFKGIDFVAISLLFNYVDRSWAMGVENFFLFSASNPNLPYMEWC
jgi:hypothetical protein